MYKLREIRDSVDHLNRSDHKLNERPEEVERLLGWQSMRDCAQGDPVTNTSDTTASLMGWYCKQVAEKHTDSDVAKIMSNTTPNGSRSHFRGNGIMMDSKTLRVAWVKAYESSQRS